MDNLNAIILRKYLHNECSADETQQVRAQIDQGISRELWEQCLKEYEEQFLHYNSQNVDRDFKLMFSKICKKLQIPNISI